MTHDILKFRIKGEIEIQNTVEYLKILYFLLCWISLPILCQKLLYVSYWKISVTIVWVVLQVLELSGVLDGRVLRWYFRILYRHWSSLLLIAYWAIRFWWSFQGWIGTSWISQLSKSRPSILSHWLYLWESFERILFFLARVPSSRDRERFIQYIRHGYARRWLSVLQRCEM